MFVNDPRVFWRTSDTNRIPIAPPNALHRLTIMPTDPVSPFLKGVAEIASLEGKLDALHLFAHGSPGYLEFGAEGLDRKNADVFKPLRDKVRVIVIYGCNSGRDISPGQINVHGWSFGGGVAEVTNAKVIVCSEIQYHSVIGSATGRGGVAMQDNGFEGNIYICSPNGDTLTVYKDSKTGKALIDLETYVFGTNGN